MRVRLRKLLLLALAGAAPFASSRVAAQGLLAPLFGSEMEQDYETGAGRPTASPAAKPSIKPQRGKTEARSAGERAGARKATRGRAAPKIETPNDLPDGTADRAGPDDAAADATGSLKREPVKRAAKPSPKPASKASASKAQPPKDAGAAATDASESSGQAAAENPEASADTTGALKPKKKPIPKRIIANAPLPPPRPWGDGDAPGGETDTAAALPPTTDVRAPEPVAPAQEQEHKPKSLVVLAKSGLRSPEDLKDRRIATGLSGETPQRLKEVVEQGAGLRLDPVDMSWGAGLVSLAKGEVDGVTVSLGPPLTPEETRGVAMGNFQLLEVPLDGEAGAGRR